MEGRTGKHVKDQLQVNVAVPLAVPPPVSRPSLAVAVTLTGPAVAPMQVAVPYVWSFTLLMLTLTVSETDHVAKLKGIGGGMQPEGSVNPAMNCCWLPGDAAVWLATAL
jgi:hypothetical protein